MNPVPPILGQKQPVGIPVPKRIQYQSLDGEDGPWSMIPYAWLYPPPPRAMRTRVPQPLYRSKSGFSQANMPVRYEYVTENDRTWLPPPVYTTDLWAANQVWPL